MKYTITINNTPASTNADVPYEKLMSLLGTTTQTGDRNNTPCFDDMFCHAENRTWHPLNRAPIVKGGRIEITTFINAPFKNVSLNKVMSMRHCCGDRARPCAVKFAAGKCRDPFMCKIGALIWPALYAKKNAR